MKNLLCRFAVLVLFAHHTLQDCHEETSYNGISVTWQATTTADNVESKPLCYNNGQLVTRNCTNSTWIPPLDQLQMCLKVVHYFDLASCPPGFHRISQINNDYCYQIHEISVWDFPCLESGGASVITDLDSEEIESLFDSLNSLNSSRYYWLPAMRPMVFQPMVWYIPGSNWGRRVENLDILPIIWNPFKKCLLLDIEQRALVQEACNKVYPSLCFYVNDLKYPAKCPNGYHAFRFMSNDSVCLGIEKSDNASGLSYRDFIKTKCSKPMGRNDYGSFKRFLFKKIAEIDKIPNDTWCWFTELNNYTNSVTNSNVSNVIVSDYLEAVINNIGTLSLINTGALLPCMACETDFFYGESEISLEYNENENKIYVTIYFPSGLWKYDMDDKGIQCFSDAQGFINVIEICDLPFIENVNNNTAYLENSLEKVVYAIDLISDMSAQYWCEGHTKNFSLITTEKIVVNPQGGQVHVFSLHISTNIEYFHDLSDMSELVENISNIFKAEKTLIMTISTHTANEVKLMMHLHVSINRTRDIVGEHLLTIYTVLYNTAENELPKYGYYFINLASATLCLQTTSYDYIVLNWDITPIGHFATPIQFCLQNNGLPVKRLCYGSYVEGSQWGDVEGSCYQNFEPTSTTTFLYEFVNGYHSQNTTSSFLTKGLNYVLRDTDIMIPADIYYLSTSLNYILSVAKINQTAIDMGDIDNIAWFMDRIMNVDNGSLHLAQTLNSSNVLLDTVKSIIEILAQERYFKDQSLLKYDYQLAVKDQFIIQISYPLHNNVTGLALYNTGLSDKFTNMRIQPLYRNMTLNDIKWENLEIATWLPEQVLNSLKRIKNNDEELTESDDMYITINVYHNDAVFQELIRNDKHSINSRIMEISVPGYISNLEYPVPLLFKDINATSGSTKFCGYWNFKTPKIGYIPGTWAKEGCLTTRSFNNITICDCYHLTHFGNLIAIENFRTENNNNDHNSHAQILNIITVVGSFLSLVGIIGIWITALSFQTWRKKPGTKVLLQLSTSIALPMILMIFFNFDNQIFTIYNEEYVIATHMRSLCVVLGALLHYSILANFMWMLITATLQFVRYVRVLGVARPSRFMFKFTILGWGVPFIPVTITLSLSYESYIPNPSISHPICYPNGIYFIFGIVVPICIILCINAVLFVMVIRAIAQCPDMRITDKTLIWAQLRLSIFLIFLLGLTWLFGIFSFTRYIIWSYLFCLTSTIQGFVLFIYFVICDPSTRNLWVTIVKPEFPSNSSRKSAVSISSG